MNPIVIFKKLDSNGKFKRLPCIRMSECQTDAKIAHFQLQAIKYDGQYVTKIDGSSITTEHCKMQKAEYFTIYEILDTAEKLLASHNYFIIVNTRTGAEVAVINDRYYWQQGNKFIQTPQTIYNDKRF